MFWGSSHDIQKYGAVSEKVVVDMARGALKIFGTDYSVATSGIAGPDGGTIDKPVGITWIAVASKEKTMARLFYFGSDRERNILRGSYSALNLLRQFITQKP
ncbi:MAG: CinA family protein [Bacteroidales bacterium]|nr:CinA family protein [Bacteroidales bacterium]